MTRKPADREEPTAEVAAHSVLQEIENALRGLQFGQLTVIVHNGVVIQLERTERKRLQPNGKRA